MSEKYVVRLKNAAIYHADNPFGSTSAEKLMRRGEMVLSDVNLCVAPGEFVYLIGRVGSGKSTLLKTLYAEVQLLTGEGRVAGYDLRRLRRRDIPGLSRLCRSTGCIGQSLCNHRPGCDSLLYAERQTV